MVCSALALLSFFAPVWWLPSSAAQDSDAHTRTRMDRSRDVEGKEKRVQGRGPLASLVS